VFGAGEDQPPARAAQRLVSRTGDEVRDPDWARVEPRGDQPGVVCDVRDQVRASRVGDFPQSPPVDHAGIGRGAGNDHSRFVLAREALHVVVIDRLLGVQAV